MKDHNVSSSPSLKAHPPLPAESVITAPPSQLFPEGTNVEGLAADPGAPATFRMALIAFLSAIIGILAGIVAFLLFNLIALFTNLVFYHRASFVFQSARNHHLG